VRISSCIVAVMLELKCCRVDWVLGLLVAVVCYMVVLSVGGG